MENIKEQFARLYMELDLTDDQAAMIKKLQRGINDPLSKQPTDSQSFKRLKSLAVFSFLFPYKTWIEMREKSKDEYGEKLCYCGHTYKCTCSNPDKTLFKESIKRGSIIKFKT